MEILLFDEVLKAGIMFIQYLMDVVFPVVHGSAMRSLSALNRAFLRGRWMKGAVPLQSSAQTKARELAKQLAGEGQPVIANLGGAGAAHEPANAININNQVVGRKNIPNHVLADANDIGKLFEPATVDRIEGYGMAPGVLRWKQAAGGMKLVLKAGGKIRYRTRWPAPEDAKVAVQALKDEGFVEVENMADTIISATRP